jgi:putative FmdB family regulatory protein
MPLYEYKCQSCGEVFEVIQKFSDQPVAVHEKCGGPVEKLISTSALQFKGSGWYVNDYGKGKAAKEPKPAAAANGDRKPSAPAAETSTKSDTSSTTTPAATKSDNK